MMQCILPCVLGIILVILAMTDGRPQDLQDSIYSVINSLEVAEPPSLVEERRRSRPRIITKYDFMPSRNKKSHLELPPEFVVSTGLTVTQQKQDEALSQRSGRSQKMYGSRQAKTNFVNLAEAVEAAPVIHGRRLPDDETDKVVHRNGRFINNIFVPNSANTFLPQEFVVRTQIGGNKKPLDRSGRSFLSQYEGTDRSPYTFEQTVPQASQHQQPAVIQASNEDFIIREQTYQMCPTCPSFSIPVPIPRESQSYNAVVNPNNDLGNKKTIMQRIMALIQPAMDTAREFFSADSEQNEVNNYGFANRVSAVDQSGESKISGPMYAGMATVGIALAALLSSGIASGSLSNVGRKFNEDALESLNSIDNDVLKYDIGDILCMPRNYCEKLRKKKYLIDQYPNMKLVATFMADKYFETVDMSENQLYSQCNLRECIMALLD